MAKKYTGWAYISGAAGEGADGPVGAVQYKKDGSSTEQTGSVNFVFSEGAAALFLTGTMHVDGTITSNNFDVVNHTVSYLSASGDSKFGDTAGDTHQFTGSVEVLGQISSSAEVSASAFWGDGANLSNLPASGAPTTAQYVTLAADGTLANERVLTPGANIGFTDAGAGGALTIVSSASAAGVFTHLNSTQAYTTSSVAIGEVTIPSGTLHVQSAIAGVSPHAYADNLIVETAGAHGGISVLNDDTYQNWIAMGHTSDNITSHWSDSYATKIASFGSDNIYYRTAIASGNGSNALVLDTAQNAHVLGNLTVTGSTIVSGNVAFPGNAISGSAGAVITMDAFNNVTFANYATVTQKLKIGGNALRDSTGADIISFITGSQTVVIEGPLSASEGVYARNPMNFPGALLAYKASGSKSSTTEETFTPSSTSFAYVVDSGGQKVDTGPFTAPVGGRIEVEASMWCDQHTIGNPAYFLKLALSDTSGGWSTWQLTEKNVYLGTEHSSVQAQGLVTMRWFIDGLTGGDPYTLYLGAAETNASQTHNIIWGGDYPAITMKVTTVNW